MADSTAATGRARCPGTRVRRCVAEFPDRVFNHVGFEKDDRGLLELTAGQLERMISVEVAIIHFVDCQKPFDVLARFFQVTLLAA